MCATLLIFVLGWGIVLAAQLEARSLYNFHLKISAVPQARTREAGSHHVIILCSNDFHGMVALRCYKVRPKRARKPLSGGEEP